MVEYRSLVVEGGLDVLVVVPTAVGHGDEANSGFHEAPREQHALTRGVFAVAFLDFVAFLAHVESLAGLLGADE